MKKKSNKCFKAAMTIEASILLPFFLFIFLNLISVMEAYRLQASVKASLWNTGRIMSEYSYITRNKTSDSAIQKKMLSIGFSEVYVKKKLQEDLNNTSAFSMVLPKGEEKISLLGSSILESNDLIMLQASYEIVPLFGFLPGLKQHQQVTYKGHAWTGYQVAEGKSEKLQNEDYVYITKTGVVYHENPNCSYLNPQIMESDGEHIHEIRNNSGGKYAPCQVCRPNQNSDKYYITKYGDAFHASSQCPSLKRTVYKVKLSEIGTRTPCSKCSR